MFLLLVYLFTALTFSFLCSIMEAVLLSTPPTFLKINENSPDGGLRKLIRYRQGVDRPLSAILSINTMAHTVGAAGVGAQASVVFGDDSFGWVSAVLTLLILVLTEIIPKTLGAKYWRNLAGLVGHLVQATIVLAYPLVVFSSLLTRLMSGGHAHATTSREEISALAEIGTSEGIFQDKENKIIQNLIKLKNVRVAEIMTPRTVVTLVSEDTLLEEFLKNKDYLRFSRIPVFSGNSDNITGYVFRQAVFEELALDKSKMSLRDIKKPIVMVPDKQPVFALWEKLLEKKEHIALVVDEYGGLDGIVTMEDIIETLLGFEIVDEKDVVADMQEYARDRWVKRQAKYKLLEGAGQTSDDGPKA